MTIFYIVCAIWLLIGLISSVLVCIGYYMTEDQDITLVDVFVVAMLTLFGVLSFAFFINEFKDNIIAWAETKVIFKSRSKRQEEKEETK